MNFQDQNPFLKGLSGLMIMSAQAFWLWVFSALVLGVGIGFGLSWARALSVENKRLKLLTDGRLGSATGGGADRQVKALEEMRR